MNLIISVNPMSNPYLSRVQQKLAHCRLTLELYSTDAPIQQQKALIEAALVHLAVALRLYVREVGHYRDLPMPDRLYNVDDLLTQTAGGVAVDELAEREFVASIEAAEKSVLNPAVGGVKMIAASINSVTVTDLDLAQVKHWLQDFETLAERQRQSFLEY